MSDENANVGYGQDEGYDYYFNNALKINNKAGILFN
jgi:hypothetical protein